MTTSRRKFIRNTGLTLAGTALLPQLKLNHLKEKKHITGVQLYSVRDDMKKDPLATLKQLKQLGYNHVEHAGYADRKFYGYAPEEFKKILSDKGLIMLSGHSFLGNSTWDKTAGDFKKDWTYIMEDAAAVGMEYVISPGVDESLCKNLDDFNWYMSLFNKSGEIAKKAGVKFAYHNESYEFNHKLKDTVIYDLLLSSTDPKLVAQQIDIGNMYGTGGRAMDYLKRYPGRFDLMHVKDEIKNSNTGETGEGYDSTTLGEGVIGVKEIVDFALKSGTTQFIIEQESYQGKEPLVCMGEDLTIMKKWGF